ncbi:hypothetical protein K505DRAFT_344177 [Melanomma pulvis-pyrius CBS 109.77]|uniref:Uncharacterized protein n=1 Tax=Melanomma pulvis-pyrius CBS 109.77 TaxID=1314802 RepID=A0A6A6WPZ8_9PLEO|nr:hypothetical protein K505DRAFT_344177 [Melanomma pulvis-pyrius CBS 109.77]
MCTTTVRYEVHTNVAFYVSLKTPSQSFTRPLQPSPFTAASVPRLPNSRSSPSIKSSSFESPILASDRQSARASISGFGRRLPTEARSRYDRRGWWVSCEHGWSVFSLHRPFTRLAPQPTHNLLLIRLLLQTPGRWFAKPQIPGPKEFSKSTDGIDFAASCTSPDTTTRPAIEA